MWERLEGFYDAYDTTTEPLLVEGLGFLFKLEAYFFFEALRAFSVVEPPL
jgi:hypothetical protein